MPGVVAHRTHAPTGVLATRLLGGVWGCNYVCRMDVEILDLVRRCMRRLGALGFLASILFGLTVELPVAEREALAETNHLERSLEASWKRSFAEAVHVAERNGHRPQLGNRVHR